MGLASINNKRKLTKTNDGSDSVTPRRPVTQFLDVIQSAKYLETCSVCTNLRASILLPYLHLVRSFISVLRHLYSLTSGQLAAQGASWRKALSVTFFLDFVPRDSASPTSLISDWLIGLKWPIFLIKELNAVCWTCITLQLPWVIKHVFPMRVMG